MLSIDTVQQKDVYIISLKGELLFNELDEADKAFGRVIGEKPRVLALDCKNLTSLDSSGLGLFIKFTKEASKLDIVLVFLEITGHVSTLFDVSKLESLFEIMSEREFKNTYLD